MKKCLICSAQVNFFASTGNLKIYKCPNCGFGFTDQLQVNKGDYHRDEVYIQEGDLFRNIFQKRVDIINRFAEKGKVLEVGCSTGLMLSLFQKKGWEVTGVEVSKKAAAVAKKKGLEIITTPFEDIDFNQKFDVVIFNHTLEHLKDPVSALQKAAKLLTNRGVLYIDLPNFSSFSANLQNVDWPLLLPNEHMWHFTFDSLNILLKKNGFKIVYDERASGIWDLASPLEDLIRAFFGLKKRFFTQILTAIPSLILTRLKLGSDLMVIAKKA